MAGRPNRGIHEYAELLGLQTYGQEGAVKRRPAFRYEPVIELYKTELALLFGLLLGDKGAVHDRNDPRLFDKELDTLLKTYGPQIWPKLGQGSRAHLLKPQEGTLYTSDLVYPRDNAILKKHLRGIILSKHIRPDADIDALISKAHKDSRLNLLKDAGSDQLTPRKRKSRGPEASRLERQRYSKNVGYQKVMAESSSEDSVIGTGTRQQTRRRGRHSVGAPLKIELRLYRRTPQIISPSPGPVCPYGDMFLTTEWDTSGDCFSRVCEKIEADCSFMIFHLPEDMSHEGQIRLDRGSRDSEATFQHILDILQKARRFPGEPQHRSVEVEVGLDMPSDD